MESAASLMEFFELQTKVLDTRFREARRPQAKDWINWRYTWVNAQADWPWQAPAQQDFDIAGNELAVGVNVSRILNVRDVTNDSDLKYLAGVEFKRMYSETDTASTPETYTLDTDDTGAVVLKLGPPSAETTTVEIAFTRRPLMLVADTDVPLWPENYHYLLVLGAASTGLKIENDPTWEALETEFLAGLDTMKTDILPPHQPEPRQYGRELTDAWP